MKKSTLIKHNGDRARIRTWDPQLRRLLLYPTELRDRFTKVICESIVITNLADVGKRSFVGSGAAQKGRLAARAWYLSIVDPPLDHDFTFIFAILG
jgi:hypothetical protein